MRRVMLIHPDVSRYRILDAGSVFPSVGFGYLAASLSECGYEVRCLDGFSIAALGLPATNDSFLRVTEELMEEFRPDVVGVTTASHTRNYCVDVARTVKRVDAGVTVVFGGPFASLLGSELLTQYNDIIDFIVRGEGEESFPLLLASLANGNYRPDVPGVGYFANGRVHQGPPPSRIRKLDHLPYPDYHGHVGLDRVGKITVAGMVTSRGCPHNCHFCGSQAFWGHPCIRMSPTRVVSEMEYLQQEYGTEFFKFHDDAFTLPRRRACQIFQEIRRRELSVRLYMHTTIDGVDPDLLEAYRVAGGESIFFGLESGSPRVRKLIGKPPGDFQAFLATVRIAKNLGISVGVFVLLGYPGESISDIRATFSLLEQVKPDDIYVSTVKLQPGTQLSAEMTEAGLHADSLWFTGNQEYFACVDHSDKREFIQGCILLLDEMYRKQRSRSSFENNCEASELRRYREDCGTLKAEAERVLNL